MKEPVRGILWAHPGTMARDGFLLFFFILSPFSLPLIRLHRKSELPFVCNGESRKGEGARSAAREKKEWKRSRRRGRMRRVWRVAWEQRKATRRKMQRDGSASQPLLLASLSLPFSLHLLLLHFIACLFLSPSRRRLPYPEPLPRFHNLSSGFQ